MKRNRDNFLAIILCVVITIIAIVLRNGFTGSSNMKIFSEEAFIPSNPKCGDLHGPVWVDNSCWMDTSLVALFGPENTRMYFYQFLEPDSNDGLEKKNIKSSLQTMVDSMWNTLESKSKNGGGDGGGDGGNGGGDGGGIGDRVSTKEDSQNFRNRLKQLYQGEFHNNYREISGFVKSGDLNYTHRFLSDLCFILGIPGLPLQDELTNQSVTYLLPPPDYSFDKKNTMWKSFAKIEDWEKFTLQTAHPFLWYRCSFRNSTSIPNYRTIQTTGGGKTHVYEICAIVILAFQHYVTYFRCGGKWFLYDGLMEEDPVIEMDFESFDSNLSKDKLYQATLSSSIFSRLENSNSPKKVFDPRHAWLAPNGVDYEGDALCMYGLKKG